MNIVIGWPEGILLGILVSEFGFQVAKHGEPRTTAHDANYYLFTVLVLVGLLYWGGFFS